MGIVEFFKGLFGSSSKSSEADKNTAKAKEPLGGADKSQANKKGYEYKEFTFEKIPTTMEEFLAIPEASLKTPYECAAVCALALCTYKTDKDLCFKLLEYLNGPTELTERFRQFITDRLRGKEYKPFSFFLGSSPENDYTPTFPLKIVVESGPYSFLELEEGYATLYLKSTGADSSRPIALRRKGQEAWFYRDLTFLSDIRIPKSQDAWA